MGSAAGDAVMRSAGTECLVIHAAELVTLADGPPAVVRGNPEVIAAYLGSRSGRA